MRPTWAQLVLFWVVMVLMSINNALVRTGHNPRSSGASMTRRRGLDHYAIAPVGAALAILAFVQHSWLFTAGGVFFCLYGIVAPRSQVGHADRREQKRPH